MLRVLAATVAAVVALAASDVLAEPSLQLRIAWGGLVPATARQWQGTISIDQGKLNFVRALGTEADEPGSMWLDGNRISVSERSPRHYDGADVLITAPLTAVVSVELRDVLNPGAPPIVTEATLGDLIGKQPDSASKSISKELDKTGNKLLIRRAPGDALRVVFQRDHLIFAPGETFQLEVEPQLLSIPTGTSLQLRGRLVSPASGKEYFTQEQSIKSIGEETAPASVPWQIKMPQSEGVYDLVFEAVVPASALWTKSKIVSDRHVQVIVVADKTPALATDAETPWSTVMEIDPANPRWFAAFKAWSLLPGLQQGTLGNVPVQTVPHPLGAISQMSPNPPSGDVHWEAYPLTISHPGMPHILEVEYPSDVPQALGISIVEPNAGGLVLPIELDSGVVVDPEYTAGPPKWEKHRLLFWPRTKLPIVLLTNRRDGSRAVYGKIRVLAGPSRLPPEFPAGDLPERLLAGYQSRPYVPENFGAPQAFDAISQRSLHDWQTFYDGATRLADYLNYRGYGGEMLTVLADGSSIYPSNIVDPTPFYDTGVYFDTAQDPLRKDALELILRVFDREGLKLIPAMQFVAPLPGLEARLRQGGQAAAGIQLIGPEGKSYTEKYPPILGAAPGVAPYYNPLNEQVQDAILASVREVVLRYSKHPALAGVALELSADGYTQLPGDLWGLDDDTIARFQRATNIQVPGDGPLRFQQRAEFFAANSGPGTQPKPQREAWLKWRAGILAEFYLRLQRELAASRPDAVFYLAATNLFDSPDSKKLMRPDLQSKSRLEEAMLAIGIRPELLRNQNGLVLLRPERFLPPGPLMASGADLELNRDSDFDNLLRGGSSAGMLFMHDPQTTYLPSFDAKSPFGKDKTLTQMASQFLPSGRNNRQRFVHGMAAMDPDTMFDGGWLLPMGQEDSLVDLMAAFRRLPVGKFETFADISQPVTIRTLVTHNSTYAYFLNDSPWSLNLQLQLNVPPGCRIEELSGRRKLPALSGTNWTLTLEPYDLVAVRFPVSNVSVRKAEFEVDSKFTDSLDQQVHDLQRFVGALDSPTSLPVLTNPSFENPVKSGKIEGWSLVNAAAGEISIEAEGANPPNKPVGKQALRFKSNAPAALVSDPFAAPSTGRLLMRVWLKVDDAKQQPPLLLAIQGVYKDKVYYRPVLIGAALPNAPPPQATIQDQWTKVDYVVEDLPAVGLDKLRVRFGLAGSGSVLIDDVQLFDLAFNKQEIAQLNFEAFVANRLFKKGNYGECLNKLQEFWPRFLATYVPLEQPQLVAQRPAQTPGNGQAPAANSAGKAEEKSAAKPSGPLEKLNRLWKQ